MVAAATREFWKIAAGFPANKEEVYLDHAEAQEFSSNIGKVVLEYGCGGGSDTLSYLRRGCTVYFVDIVPGNVLATNNRVLDGGYKGKGLPVLIQQSDVIKVGASGLIDVISAHGVLHHIASPQIVRSTLAEFHRLLRPGGKLYVMLYTESLWANSLPQMEKLIETKGLTEFQAFGQITDGEGCPHATAYDEVDGRELLTDCGFDVTSTFVYNNGDFRTFRATSR